LIRMYLSARAGFSPVPEHSLDGANARRAERFKRGPAMVNGVTVAPETREF